MNTNQNYNNWFAPRIFLRFIVGGVISAATVFLIAASETAKGDPGMIITIIIAPIIVFIPGGLLAVSIGTFYYFITKKITIVTLIKEVSITLILPGILLLLIVFYLQSYFGKLN